MVRTLLEEFCENEAVPDRHGSHTISLNRHGNSSAGQDRMCRLVRPVRNAGPALLWPQPDLAFAPGRRPAFLSQAPALAPPPVLVVNWRDMTTPPSPSQSAEDYLERIHELIEEKGYARVVDIATSLQVKQASVTSMVQKLGELGYLNYEKYRGLVLTEKGKRVACGIQKRHETLSRFFSLFGLDPETQKQDIEGIEHHLSADTVQVLADLARFFESNPETLKQYLKSRRLPK